MDKLARTQILASLPEADREPVMGVIRTVAREIVQQQEQEITMRYRQQGMSLRAAQAQMRAEIYSDPDWFPSVMIAAGGHAIGDVVKAAYEAGMRAAAGTATEPPPPAKPAAKPERPAPAPGVGFSGGAARAPQGGEQRSGGIVISAEARAFAKEWDVSPEAAARALQGQGIK